MDGNELNSFCCPFISLSLPLIWHFRLWDFPRFAAIGGRLHLGKHLTLTHVSVLFQPHAAQKAITQQSQAVLRAAGLVPAALLMKQFRHWSHCSLKQLQNRRASANVAWQQRKTKTTQAALQRRTHPLSKVNGK